MSHKANIPLVKSWFQHPCTNIVRICVCMYVHAYRRVRLFDFSNISTYNCTAEIPVSKLRCEVFYFTDGPSRMMTGLIPTTRSWMYEDIILVKYLCAMAVARLYCCAIVCQISFPHCKHVSMLSGVKLSKCWNWQVTVTFRFIAYQMHRSV